MKKIIYNDREFWVQVREGRWYRQRRAPDNIDDAPLSLEEKIIILLCEEFLGLK